MVDTATNHLFIADSSHNRVVIANLNGKVEAVAGSGVAGLRDGAFDIANFQNPQGMALWQDEDKSTVLLVADTGNHAIRALDLTRGKVTTLAGTGVSDPWRGSGLRADARLSSPWDLQVIGSTLYIAVAGAHQIWVMDLPSRQVSLYAGSSREAREDGSLTHASFAQPSGLATDGKRLFVADSETSTIRAVDLPGHGSQVRTLAGGDLFQFGDRDGVGDAARLQHPLGLAYHDGVIYITDTYNHKIKMLNSTTGRVHVLLGNGAGVLDGIKPQFYEPGGLSIGGDKIYVADTNNHKIRIIDLKSKSVSTLSLQNLPLPLPTEPGLATAPSRRDTIIVLPPARLRPNTRGEIALDIKLPPGHELNRESPQHFGAHAEGKGLTITSSAVEAGVLNLPLRIPIATGPVGGHGVITAAATIFYCSHERGICKMKSFNFRAPFTVADRGARSLTLHAELE
jgi:sugar lactone lactonase YvrE